MNYFQKMNTFPYNLAKKREEKRREESNHSVTNNQAETQRRIQERFLQQERVAAGLHPITGKPVIQANEMTIEEIKAARKKLTEARRKIREKANKEARKKYLELHPKPSRKDQIEKPFVNYTSVINKVESVIGTSYHRLTYVGFGDKRRTIKVKCECGTIKDIKVHYIHFVKSCGCMCKEAKHQSTTPPTHGLSRTVEYQVWYNMHCRCYKSNNRGFKTRGKLGIEVCERWHDVETFIKDVGLRPSPSHVFRRIDKNKNYTPDNYHWIIPE